MSRRLRTLFIVLISAVCMLCACGLVGCGEFLTPGGQPNADCEHALTYHKALPATCESAGTAEYWQCNKCEKYFSDEEANTETTLEGLTMSALGHDLEGTVCEGQSCTRCDYTVEGVGHTPDEDAWEYKGDRRPVDDHCTYEDTRRTVCTVCGETVTEKYLLENQHVYITQIKKVATCSTDGEIETVCSVCGDVAFIRSYSDDYAHAWNSGTTENGVTTYTCQHNPNHVKRAIVSDTGSASFTKEALSEVDEIEIAGAAISFDTTAMSSLPDEEVELSVEVVDEIALDPAVQEKLTSEVYDITLTSGGSAITNFGGGTATVRLSYTLKAGEDLSSLVVWYIDGTNMEPIPASYEGGYVVFETTHFSLYSVGSYTEENACEVLGHSVITRTQNPTCTEDGYTEQFCARCGETISKNTLPKTGHDYEAVVTLPTCEAGGYTTYTCKVCGDTFTADETSARGHDYEAVVTLPTCETGGYTTYTCKVCGDAYTADETNPTGHAWVLNTDASVAATCTKNGEDVYECFGCHSWRTETIPATGHIWNLEEPTCAEDKKCTVCGTVDSPATGNHNFVNGECTVCGAFDGTHVWERIEETAPTCSQYGYVRYHCTEPDCGRERYDLIAPLGHDYGTEECVRCGFAKSEESDLFLLENLGGNPDEVGAYYGEYAIGVYNKNVRGDVTYTFELVFIKNGKQQTRALRSSVDAYGFYYRTPYEVIGERPMAYILQIYDWMLKEEIWTDFDFETMCFLGVNVTLTAASGSATIFLPDTTMRLHDYETTTYLGHDDVDCGEYYGWIYTCKRCGFVDTSSWRVKQHYIQTKYELAPNATDCNEGIVPVEYCTYCGEEFGRGEVIVQGGHKNWNETISLRSTSSGLVQELTLWTCACGWSKSVTMNNNRGCRFSVYDERTFEEGHYLITEICRDCGVVRTIEGWSTLEGCVSRSYTVYRYFEEDGITPIGDENGYWSIYTTYRHGTTEKTTVEFNFDEHGYTGSRTTTVYSGCEHEVGYTQISETRYDGYGRTIYSLSSRLDGDVYTSYRRIEYHFDGCDYTYYLYESPEGEATTTYTGALHLFDYTYTQPTCTQPGEAFGVCRLCAAEDFHYSSDPTGHRFTYQDNRAVCETCGYYTTNGWLEWSAVEDLTDYAEGEYYIIGAFGRNTERNGTVTFLLVFRDENGIEHTVEITVAYELIYLISYEYEPTPEPEPGVDQPEIVEPDYHEGYDWVAHYKFLRADIAAELAKHPEMAEYKYLGVRVIFHYEEGNFEQAITLGENKKVCGHIWMYDQFGAFCFICHEYCEHEFDIGYRCFNCGYYCEHPDFEEGLCTVCGYVCQHGPFSGIDAHTHVCKTCLLEFDHNYDKNSGWCPDCGDQCWHRTDDGENAFVSGICSVCGYTCTHPGMYNGYCPECGITCYHESGWTNGKCNDCGYPCRHYYEDTGDSAFRGDTCLICGYTCAHSYHDFYGECTTCREYIGHTWENGKCTVCDRRCAHEFDENNACGICGITCAHEWSENGYCTVCGYYCRHSMEGNQCTICGFTCYHVGEWGENLFEQGFCMACGAPCAHNWVVYDWGDYTYCSICHYECYHRDNFGNRTFDEHDTCTVCGYTCAQHRYIDGACEVCGKTCEHIWDLGGDEWSDSWCQICGLPCDHRDRTNCICNTCGKTLPYGHMYNSATGKCIYCETECEHKFAGNGIDFGCCDICGYVCPHGEYVYGEYFYNEHTGMSFWNDFPAQYHFCKLCSGDGNLLRHRYVNGVCTDCGYTCEHREKWDTTGDGMEDTCRDCGYGACAHASHNSYGYCSRCDAFIGHNYENGTCAGCVSPCGHDRHDNYGLCWECRTYVGHTYENGSQHCSVCGTYCNHNLTDFKEGRPCSYCGITCPHWFNNSDEWGSTEGESVCSVCGYMCEHVYENGSPYCIICSKLCGHPEGHGRDGICPVCHASCGHGPYVEGHCEICGVECEHVFRINGHCEICGVECAHDFAGGGYCVVCGRSQDGHEHTFKDGACTRCGYTCKHMWLVWQPEHQCDICGMFESHKFTEIDEHGPYCAVCGYHCDHMMGFAKGRCITCNWECDHIGHTSYWNSNDDTHYCNLCGANTAHDYVLDVWGARCSVCDWSCTHMRLKDGHCDICNWTCSHNGEWKWRPDCHICNGCGLEFKHDFVISGSYAYCSTCNYNCYHDGGLENGKCNICGWECSHYGGFVYYDEFYHQCPSCWKSFPHSFNSEYTCESCSFHCDHHFGFMDGACAICHFECAHSWASDGAENSGEHVCQVCWVSEKHHFVQVGGEAQCTECGFTCGHGWFFEGVCEACGWKCDHAGTLYDWSEIEHHCDRCQFTEAHKFNEQGYCSDCGRWCDHNNGFTEGKCMLCGWECTHIYGWSQEERGHSCNKCWAYFAHNYSYGENAYCSDCGYTCYHSGWLSGGRCGLCGWECMHSSGWMWSNEQEHYCNACQMSEPHEWENGYCNGCQMECMHSYDWEGHCMNCGKQCTHPNLGWDGYCPDCWQWFETEEPEPAPMD